MPSVSRRTRLIFARLGVALLLAPVAIAAVAVPAARPARAAQHAVGIADSAFAPTALTVTVGDAVTWTNADDRPHTVTADGGTFDSGNLDPGQTFTTTFETAGTFTYACAYHPDMRATILVVPGAAPAAPAAREAAAPTTAVVPAAEVPADAPVHRAGPDTALSAPATPVVVPALLAGLGLVSLAIAALPGRRRTAAPAQRSGGWRR